MSNALSLRRVPLLTIRAHPVRSLIIAVLALAQAACVFGGLILVGAMRAELTLAERRLGADLVVYPTTCLNQVEKKRLLMLGTPVGCHQPRSALARMSSNEDIAAVSYQLYVSETMADGTTRWIVGFEPESDFALSPWIAEGEGSSLPRGSVLVGSAVPGADGQSLSVFGRERPIGAHLLATGSELDDAVFVSMGTLTDMMADARAAGEGIDASLDPSTDYSAALVRASDSDAIESVTNWINLYVRKVSAVRSSEALVGAASGIRAHRGVAIGVLGATWLVLLGALIIVQVSLMNERMQELAVWRSIGASRSVVSRVMLSESALLHAAGALAGVCLAAVTMPFVGDGSLVEVLAAPATSLPLAGLSLVAVTCVGVAGTHLALARVSRAATGNKSVLV
ncbi:MAG: ABC transporter permease [Thermobifida sp.]|nr:ABC transporter permease [Thermobifida sp.]